MAPSLSRVSDFWNAWGLRITSYLSFSAHVLLVVLARSRRHGTSRWQRFFLWLAYQTAEIAATYALGDLSLSGTDGGDAASPSRQQQLVAFWAPFFLLHLGGPDNITAYALEDNKLSKRKVYEIVVQLIGVLFTLYNYIYLGGSRALLAASVVMALLALAKYAEKAYSLYQAQDKLDNKQSSSEEEGMSSSSHHMDPFVSASSRGEVDNEQALLYAHNLFRFCKHAMFDSSVHVADDDDDSSGGGYPASVKIFSLDWKGIFKVVEMEISLMYDILYTKAAVVHTWIGYVLRLISPVATAAAAALFWTWAHPAEHGLLEPADVRFTYIMLATAFLLDVLWLVRALGSSWTYSFLTAQPPELLWLEHGVVCSGKWRQLHRVVASLDPCWLVLGKDPSSYRRWSGVTGRYNLLQECTLRADGSDDRVPSTSSHKFFTPLFGRHREDVKKMLFERIKLRLPLPKRYQQTHPKDSAYRMVEITTRWGHVAVEKFPAKSKLKIKEKLKLNFGREFQEDVLVWHIGTCIFLNCTEDELLPRRRPPHLVKAIELLSEYLMFLVAARPHMLPGLVLRSLFEDTFRALGRKWKKACEAAESNGRRNFGACRREKKLAVALHDEAVDNPDQSMRERDGRNRLMLDGIELGIQLLKYHDDEHMLEPEEGNMHDILELVFDVWVDKLVYASTRCSRESHAKQLSRGGELTTIVWIMVQHAGLFRIGETKDDPEEKKKKEAEEKKKKEEEEKKKKEYTGDVRPPPRPQAAPWEEYIDGRPPRPEPPPPPAPISERARKRRARTTVYSTLYPA